MPDKKIDRQPLLNESRRKKESQSVAGARPKRIKAETRTEIERDFDRMLFSAPVRRRADKKQVFPLDKNDSVLTRLTHSNEVLNLARSIGSALAFNSRIAATVKNAKRNLPALLALAGLVHYLGNPPFGHQGESAIQSWFADNQNNVLLILKEG